MKLSSLFVGLFTAGAAVASAAPVSIAVPNFSFESPVTESISTTIDSWVPNANDNRTGTFPNPAVDDTALDHIFTTADSHFDGNQAAFFFPLPGVSLTQTIISPDAVFVQGDIYSFTLALAADPRSTKDNEALDLVIYYMDGATRVTLAAAQVMSNYSRAHTSTISTNRINLLFDYVVTLDFSQGQVSAADLAKATGKPIGLGILGDPLTGGGYWDIDNARLTYIAIPEPATGGLLWLAGAAFLSPPPPFRAGLEMNFRFRVVRAFTLIELLVVLAIIAVLLALMMPALQNAMDAGKIASCVANLKSIGGGIAGYAADHETKIPYGPEAGRFTSMASFYPSTGSPTSLISLDTGAPVALGLLVRDYLGRTPEVLFCPGNDQAMNAQKELAKFGHQQAQCGYYYRHAGNTELFDEGLHDPPMQLGNLGLNRKGKPIRALVCDIAFMPTTGAQVAQHQHDDQSPRTDDECPLRRRPGRVVLEQQQPLLRGRAEECHARAIVQLILAVFEKADEL